MQNQEIALKQALMIYSNGNDSYIEIHEVKHGELLAGKPLTKEAIRRVWKDCYAKARVVNEAGLLPLNLLYRHKGRVIWHIPAGPHPLAFHKNLAIPSGMARCPALIFMAGQWLSVFALKWRGRPTARTKLYHAPFHNVSGSGEICMGSARRPKSNISTAKYMAGMETAFWQSEFSHIHNQNLREGVNINTLWKRLVETDEPFPNEVLRDTGKRLEDLL